MSKFKKISAALLLLFVFTGCASNNVKSYRADLSTAHHLKGKGDIVLKKVTMENGDKNAIMCRLAGNIYLPRKMTYSEYIENAFQNTILLNENKEGASGKKRALSINLTKVEFDSLSGKWFIDGIITIDNKPSQEIKSVTKFGTAYVAYAACRNAADAFDEAVTDFIVKVIDRI